MARGEQSVCVWGGISRPHVSERLRFVQAGGDNGPESGWRAKRRCAPYR